MTPRVRTTKEGLAYGMFQRQEHHRPHLHVRGPDVDASLAIEDGALLAGKISSKQLKEAQSWIQAHQAELVEMWRLRMEPGAIHEILD